MAQPTIESLARRLDHLEQQNRRLRVVGLLALGAVLVMLATLAWPKSRVMADEVVAETLAIRDSSGVVVARLESSRDGGELTLMTADNSSTVVVAAVPEARGGPVVLLTAPPVPNTNGPATAWLGVLPDGRPTLFLDSGDESATIRFWGGAGHRPPELMIESRDARRSVVSP